MMEFRLCSRILVRYPRLQVFEFFSQAENLNLLTPPWLHFSILTPLPVNMALGAVIRYRIRLRGVPIAWESAITEWEPPCRFTDTQTQGPYRSWTHRHLFEETPEGTLVSDDVLYRVPGGALVNRLFVAGELRRIFDYRRERIGEIFPG